MSGEYAEISYNGSDYNGGGVVTVGGRSGALPGYFEMSGDHAAINNNWAIHGGGVYVRAGTTFNMTGTDAEISYNYASRYGGGGVWIAEGATFNMEGIRTKINNNLTSAYTEFPSATGGGVQLEQGIFNMKGANAQINDNKAHMGGGGVFISGASIFTMDGASAQIAGNYRKYTDNGTKIYQYAGGVQINGDNDPSKTTQFILKRGSIFDSIDNVNVVVTGATASNSDGSYDGAYWAAGTTGYTGPTDSRTPVSGTPSNALVDMVTDGSHNGTIAVDLWTKLNP
jgi:hypothetical protein